MPPDIWILIAALLHFNDRRSLGATSTNMRTIVYDTPRVWRVIDATADRPVAKLKVTLIPFLTMELRDPVKANVRALILDGRSVSRDDLAHILRSCPALHTLSLRSLRSITFNSLTNLVIPINPSDPPPRIPNTLRRVLLGAHTRSEAARITWRKVSRIRNALTLAAAAPDPVDMGLAPCSRCIGCREVPPSWAVRLCARCAGTESALCRTCETKRECMACGARVCEACAPAGHDLAGCLRHRVCAECARRTRCSCGEVCCPSDECARTSADCGNCARRVCHKCLLKKQPCSKCGKKGDEQAKAKWGEMEEIWFV